MTSTSPGTPSVSSPRVTQDAQFWILTPDGRRINIRGTMLYTERDPWAVTIDFTNPDGEIAPWTFARQLLDDGRYCWQGLMDVQIGPHDREGKHVAIALTSPDGHAYVMVERSAVTFFIARTGTIIPLGAECGDAEIDAFIAGVQSRPHPLPDALPRQDPRAVRPAQPVLPTYTGGDYRYNGWSFHRRSHRPGRHRAEP
jgi:hypothetical protein